MAQLRLRVHDARAVILYNEIDSYPAQWIRNLIAAGHLPAGHVDETDIRELDHATLPPTFHAFAGLGGWALALRMAGWPDTIPVWTGSCPCQPFSTAGRRQGFNDDRHLWPAWRDAIEQRSPSIIFGEQVASPAGRAWLSVVRADLEALGYAVGGADLCAASVGAPHIRQRLWFVAVANGERLEGLRVQLRESVLETRGGGSTRIVGDTGSPGSRGNPRAVLGAQAQGGGRGRVSRGFSHESLAASATDLVGPGRPSEPRDHGEEQRASGWANADWIPCTDGKARPVESGTFPLAHGVPNRVGRVRAYGNAIVPQVAATFIRATIETIA